MIDPRDKAAIIARYEGRLADDRGKAYTLGTNFEAMVNRYAAVIKLIKPDAGSSLLDVGCGFGLLRDYLPPSITSYTGIDIVEALLPPGDDYAVLDITAEPIDEYDYIICLGVLNNFFKYSDNMAIVQEVMRKIFTAARIGIAMDFIGHPTQLGSSDDGRLFYYDVQAIHEMARELTDHVILKRDYILNENMLFLYKGDTDDRAKEKSNQH